jgi:urease accessory protein
VIPEPRTDRRTDVAACTPPVPWEMRGLCDEVAASGDGVLPVGRPGKVGVLDLSLGVDADGVTGVTSRFVKAPVQLTRPLYIDTGDPGDPGEAFVYVRTTGGGLAQNDRVRQNVRLGAGARATLTTQAATPVHRMNAGLATQWVSIGVGEEAVCEYLPGQSILFAGSRLLQVTDVHTAVHLAGDHGDDGIAAGLLADHGTGFAHSHGDGDGHTHSHSHGHSHGHSHTHTHH